MKSDQYKENKSFDIEVYLGEKAPATTENPTPETLKNADKNIYVFHPKDQRWLNLIELRRRLTTKQQVFCEEYLKTNNQKKSAENAGYSKKSSSSIAYDLLQNDDIIMYLECRLYESRLKTDISLQLIQLELLQNHYFSRKNGKISDSNKALELLGKTIGAYKEDVGNKNESFLELLKQARKVNPIGN